jgi:hypothetical protein
MTSTSPTVPAVPDLVFTDPERMALAGFLAGYRGLTRDAYALDLRPFLSFCERHGLKLFSVRRTDIELYARASADGPGRFRTPVPIDSVQRFRGFRTPFPGVSVHLADWVVVAGLS